MPDRATTVFVSYSHADSDFVAPVVSLLRATRAVVFLDADTIRPGKKWRDEIEQALQQADLVVVFWCHHSDASAEVGREYERALTLGKDILPVRLDSSPLPAALGEFQYIDFQSVAGPRHARALLAPMAAPRSSFSYWPAGLVLALGGVAALVMQLPLDLRSVPVPPVGLPGPPSPADAPIGLRWLAWAALLALLFGGFVLRRRSRATRQRQDLPAPAVLDPVQRELAGAIEAELAQRLGPKTGA